MLRGIVLFLFALLLVGCGGGGAGVVENSGSQQGGGEVPFRFAGTFEGDYSGVTSKGVAYHGTGLATISGDGTASFSYSAQADGGGPVLVRVFFGSVKGDGSFSGTNDTGESVSGTLNLDGSILHVSLTWSKKLSAGTISFTTTETFDLTKKG